MVFIMLRYVLSMPTLIRFLHEWQLNFCQMLFCVYWGDDHGILSSLLLIWCATLIDVQILNHPCDPRINQFDHGIWSFLYSVESGLLVFCRGFFCNCSNQKDICKFPFLPGLLSVFGNRVMVASQNEFGSVSSSSSFWNSLGRKVLVLLYVWYSITSL